MAIDGTVSVSEAPGERNNPWKKSVSTWIRRHPFILLAAILLSSILYEYLSLPGASTIERLRVSNPTTTAFMESRKASHRGSWKPAHQWIPLSQISPHLVHAVIVAEDGSFYVHDGIDWYEVKESFERNIEEGRLVRGASTITQQLAKNLYLSGSRDPVRKLKEWIIAMRLENALSKRRILELYLNLIEWGDGIFGAEAASQHYFGKSAGELTRDEAVRLAAVIPNPLRYNPAGASRYVSNRMRIILSRMEARGW